MRWLMIGALASAMLTSCVTEVNGVEQPDEVVRPDRGPSPLERARSDVTRLIDRLRYESGTQLYGTMQKILAYREISYEPIATALPEADTRTRANLLYLLGFVGVTEARPTIVNYLDDKDEIVRYEAAAALLGLGDFSAVPILLTMLSSDKLQLRYKAHEALAKVTRQSFGFEAHGGAADRGAAIVRWQAWWRKQRQRLLFENGIETPAEAAAAGVSGN